MNTLVRRAVEQAIAFFEANPHQWMKHHLAQRMNGDVTKPNDPLAVCWCAAGRLALELKLGELTQSRIYSRLAYDLGLAPNALWQANDNANDVGDVIAFLRSLLP